MKRLQDLISLKPKCIIEAHGNGHSRYFAKVQKKHIKIPYSLFVYAKKIGLFPVENKHLNLIK